jgi:hypothetical protein
MDAECWITPEIRRGWELEKQYRRRYLTVLAVVPGSEPVCFVAYLVNSDVQHRSLRVRGVVSVRRGVARTIWKIRTQAP